MGVFNSNDISMIFIQVVCSKNLKMITEFLFDLISDSLSLQKSLYALKEASISILPSEISRTIIMSTASLGNQIIVLCYRKV